MVAFRFRHVALESYGFHLPSTVVTSQEIEDRLSETYQRLEIPFGTLERISGIKSRHLWQPTVMPSTVATKAVEEAIDGMGINRDHIGALVSCSVTRDMFEPATACLVQSKIGLPEDVISFDISNACIGFSDGIMMIGNLIETGVIKAGIVVSGENPSCMVESTFQYINKNLDKVGREQILKVLPTFTLGCGAVAFVLCHESIATRGHRILGGVGCTASDHADLCVGNGDFALADQEKLNPIMETESSRLIPAAAKLGQRTWAKASNLLGWPSDEVDHVFCHQVGKQVNENFYKEMGLDFSKEFTIYPTHGNMVSAAMPIALLTGVEKKPVKENDKVVCTAFGSGLNSIFFGIRW